MAIGSNENPKSRVLDMDQAPCSLDLLSLVNYLSFPHTFYFLLLIWTLCTPYLLLLPLYLNPLCILYICLLSYFYFVLSPQMFSFYHKFSWIFLPPFTGILETDITFLIIFSMVFLLSCYFACKYCLLFHSFNVIGIQSPPEMQFLCQIYYKIYMVSWWDGSKFSCLFR